jgi:hypothetical protein
MVATLRKLLGSLVSSPVDMVWPASFGFVVVLLGSGLPRSICPDRGGFSYYRRRRLLALASDFSATGQQYFPSSDMVRRCRGRINVRSRWPPPTTRGRPSQFSQGTQV